MELVICFYLIYSWMVTLDGVDLKLKQFDASTLFFEVFGTVRQVNFHATEQYLLVGEVQLFKRSAEVWYVISLFFHRIFPQNVFAFARNLLTR